MRSGQARSCYYRHLSVNQLVCQRWQSFVVTLCPAIFDRDVLALDKSGFAEALTECAQAAGRQVGRFAAEETDHRHDRPLRT